MEQRYILTIWNMFTKGDEDAFGAAAVIAVMDGEKELDCFTLNGKCQCLDGYSRAYVGRPGLTAKLVSGPGTLNFKACS